MSAATTRTAGGPSISKGGSGLPSRVVIHGCEGTGKSSCGAFTPSPVFAMTRGETGLLTLIDNGLCPPTDHFDEAMAWQDLLGQIRFLIDGEHKNRTFVLDTINGAERLCFEHVVRDKYGGSWENFASYGRGPEQAQGEWIKLLLMLDELRAKRRMSIMCLSHTRIKTFKNPEGDDFDRYAPDMNEKIWGLTHKWSDVVLFLNFDTVAKKESRGGKAKGVKGDERVFYTQRTAAYDAKNRLGLPPEIAIPSTPDGCFRAMRDAMQAARSSRQTQQTNNTDDTSNTTSQED